jgi:ABC-type multidrug transport system permease subunit
MGRGGKLCFFGPPKEALPFFEKRPDFKFFSDIYLQLDKGTAEVDKWAEKYRHSEQYVNYVQTSLTPGKDEQQTTDASVHTGISPFKQLWLLSQRYWNLVNRDRVSLILALLAGPITIGLTALSLNGEEPLVHLDTPSITQASLALKLLFIFSCISIWVGLSNSIREIVKESAIYFRERLLNLGLIPYIGSKLLIRGLIALIQTILITIAVLIGFASPKSDLIPWFLGFGITTFLTLLASSSLSLMLSSYVKTENEGNGILPLVMIPQIIFSGVLFNLDEWSSKLSWLMLSRWSIGAYGSLVDVNSMAPKITGNAVDNSMAEFFEPSAVYDPTWENLALNWGILGAHTLIYLIIALFLQKKKDIF